MKGIEIFCASQASTAVCLPIEQPSSPSSSSGAGRAIDRHNPIISDARRSSCRTFPNPPCSSQYSPINPQPYHQLHHHKSKKTAPNPIGGGGDGGDQINPKNSATQKAPMKIKNVKKSSSMIRTSDIVRWNCAKPRDLVTPPGSTRYLLSDKSFRDGSSSRLSTSILPIENNKNITPNTENQERSRSTVEISSSSSPSPSSEKTTSPPIQVVVLRVSLHCRGCEGKVRKHLSKMEGVSSFNIDFAAKKVTIMGNITPQDVLESVSKVKNAQFWTSLHPTHPPSSSKIPF